MLSQPTAIFVIGPAGSGKSTVAKQLTATLSAAYLDKDTLAGPFVRYAMGCAGEDPDARESNTYYREQLMPIEYKAIFDVGRDNLLLGQSVVIDAPFAVYLADPAYLDARREDSQWPTAARAVIAKVVADPRLIRERIVTRGSDRDRWKLDNWDEFWTRYGSTECAWTGAEIVPIPNESGHGADLRDVLAALSD